MCGAFCGTGPGAFGSLPDSRSGPNRHLRAGRVTTRARTFRKHRGPCGQPAVFGGIGRFRPLPPQAGHLTRINATPSDLPFKSTGFAINPLPPQFGQSFGLTPLPPRITAILPRSFEEFAANAFALRIPNKLFCKRAMGKGFRGSKGKETQGKGSTKTGSVWISDTHACSLTIKTQGKSDNQPISQAHAHGSPRRHCAHAKEQTSPQQPLTPECCFPERRS
jgi:hypothetical protein